MIFVNDIDTKHTYNELQMKLYSGAEGFIVPNGGGGVLCCYFNKPVIMFTPSGKELRPGYLTNKESYLHKLSNNKIYPIIAGVVDENVDNKVNDYSELINKVKEVF